MKSLLLLLLTAPALGFDLTGAISTSLIPANSIDTTKLQAGSVDTNRLNTDAVVETKILDLAVTTRKIAANAVDTTKLGSGAVGQSQLQNLAVATGNLAAAAVDTTKILTGAVDTDRLNTDAVTKIKILDGAVDTGKLNSLLTSGKTCGSASTSCVLTYGADGRAYGVSNASISGASINISSVTSASMTSLTNATIGPCVVNSTLTHTNTSGVVEITYAGAYTSGSNTLVHIAPLIDGAYPPGFTAADAFSHRTVSAVMNGSFTFPVKVTTGARSYCLTGGGEGGATIVLPDAPATNFSVFSVKEL